MHKLDEIALNIELVLISIIEGVALYFLATAILGLLKGQASLTSIIFAASGLILLMVFWSQSILHAISFIRWPLQMKRMLLYFVIVILQVIAYGNLTNSVGWFFFWSIFSLVVLGVYIIDYRVIKKISPSFKHLPGGEPYVAEVLRRHKHEMNVLVPLSVVFNLIALGAIYFFGSEYPELAIAFAIVQLLIASGALIDCLRNFEERSALLPKLYEID